MKADNCAGFHCRSFRYSPLFILVAVVVIICVMLSVVLFGFWFFLFCWVFFIYSRNPCGWRNHGNNLTCFAPPRSMALDELHSAAAQATASAPASAPVKAVGIDNGN